MIQFKIFILSAFFCAANLLCAAQNVDSLRKELISYQKEDSNYIKSLTSYGYYIMHHNIDSGYICARESIDLSKKIKWDKGLIGGLLMLSQAYAFSLKYDSSVSIAMNALKISENIHDDRNTAMAHGILTECYRLMTVYNLAEFHGLRSLDFAKAAKNDLSILNALLNLYNLYNDQKKWKEGEKYYQSAMELAVKQADQYHSAVLLELRGTMEFQQKNFTEALRYYRESLSSFMKQGEHRFIAFLQTELCNTFVILKNKDSAAFYANAALENSKKYDLKKELIDSYDALFNYAYEFGNYKKAIEYRIAFDSLDKETNNQEMAQNMERSRLEFEQKKKDIIVQAEQQKKDDAAKRTRNLQFLALGVVLLIAFFLLIYSRQKQRAKTKIEKAYTELKATQQQLIQSEKMASLGELTAGIAHEIQNPLNFVNNFSEVNKELIDEAKEEMHKGNTSDVNAILDNIRDNQLKINHHGKRADAIVKGMLQHSRTSSGQKEPTDINALADEYLRLAYHGLRAKDKSLPTGQAGFNVTMKTDFDQTIGNINIIPQDIGRVVLNLINNAFYAASPPLPTGQAGSKGGISEPASNKTPTIWVSTKKDGNKIFISVRDNGPGIPSNIVDKIFQPFFTTKPTGQGTGLGLSLAYDIVKAHGGEITVESTEGKGSQFSILLPAKINE